MDFEHVCGNWPVDYGLNSQAISNSFLVGTDMAKDVSSRDSNECLLATKGHTIRLHSLDNVVDSLEMPPDKMSDTRIFWNHL
jgi:hypothetical protein